jgi:cell division septal protein FtsQ
MALAQRKENHSDERMRKVRRHATVILTAAVTALAVIVWVAKTLAQQTGAPSAETKKPEADF